MEWWLQGVKKKGNANYCLIDIEFQFEKMKTKISRKMVVIHNNVNTFNATTELCSLIRSKW